MRLIARFHTCICCFLFVASCPSVLAQQSKLFVIAQRADTNYIQTYDSLITGRYFFSRKYTSISLQGPENLANLRYRPNSTLNMGVGATYRGFTLNLAYGFPFLNPERGRGKTKYLDLQSHIYTRNWTIDFFGQFYKGYYLNPKGLGHADPQSYYLRPDLGISLFGLAVYNLRNGEKFSYRAAFLQSEWQKKSAGAFLFGGEIYAGSVTGDSAIVPSTLAADYPQRDIWRIRFLEFGPGAGYAYTLVVKKHFFVTGAATLNMDFGISREFKNDQSSDKLTISPNFIYRGVAGYNGNNWNLNFSFVGNTILVRGASSKNDYRFNTGNYRFTLAKRIKPYGRFKRQLKFFDPKE
ncbi:DUF4421 domain-containing protein [Flavihumibacter sp. RY-1]|uniref:DUF4421 domain-containing protein n=1 Tax=Flavihumibacter fluminis TaxID=2909236 RepID=A0ABS9BFD9_9BACT|nr:DUF4421 domain-containing protein [Flavihumibacter fluminis]MCF1713381.1 DUF4421 domain-containing protein [Flavihumibacter fluminis]